MSHTQSPPSVLSGADNDWRLSSQNEFLLHVYFLFLLISHLHRYVRKNSHLKEVTSSPSTSQSQPIVFANDKVKARLTPPFPQNRTSGHLAFDEQTQHDYN